MCEYILGRRPDEFGLVPDPAGYFKVKEFLKALGEIEGWKHIRQNHIHEIMMVLDAPPVETDGTVIRAVNRKDLPEISACTEVPKLLYVCIKRTAHAASAEKGLRPTVYSHVICTPDMELARRIGKRRDAHPVLLTVQAKKAQQAGVVFLSFGESIYLAEFIPPDCFTGPPPPKTPEKDKKPSAPVDEYIRKARAGTFPLAPGRPRAGKDPAGRRKDADWKKNKKRLRREKKHAWPDE